MQWVKLVIWTLVILAVIAVWRGCQQWGAGVVKFAEMAKLPPMPVMPLEPSPEPAPDPAPAP